MQKFRIHTIEGKTYLIETNRTPMYQEHGVLFYDSTGMYHKGFVPYTSLLFFTMVDNPTKEENEPYIRNLAGGF